MQIYHNVEKFCFMWYNKNIKGDFMKISAIRYGTTRLWEDQIYTFGKREDTIEISLLFFLVETDGKKILIDVGCDEMAGFELIEHKKPVKVLEENGIKKEDITDIILTHTHGDHCDCVFYYPNATVYVNEREKDSIINKMAKSQKLITFDKEFIFNEQILIKHVGGHSKGSSIVEISIDNKIYVFVGDECYHKSCFDMPNLAKSMYNANKTQEFLNEYKKSKYKTFVFHDVEIIDKLGVKTIYYNE